jgi:hypothetical protein
MRSIALIIVLSLLPICALAQAEFHGFLDVRGGSRTQSDPNEKDASLAEARLQLDIQHVSDLATFQLRSDFLYDHIADDHDIDLETGEGPVDIRELNILLSPLDFIDAKIGRQILTWGTGDLLFINDLFPKDWQSFFSGRDEEYLKAPSDAFFVSFFPSFADIDLAYIPRFDSDRSISGERISYWNPMMGETAGRNAVVNPDRPDEWFDDDEITVRISKNVGGIELATYAYNGYWKNPKGIDPLTSTAFFPRLSAYGVSGRSGLGKGLLNAETGFYDSRDDDGGTDPFVPNSEVRALVGYERELAKNLSGGIQYYVEHMQHYSDYRASLPQGMQARDENRQLTTLRLTKQAMNQNLTLSLFVYYSYTDDDAYLRPIVKYKLTDSWLLTCGGNVFLGEHDYTFFGQFDNNNNVYAGARYSF